MKRMNFFKTISKFYEPYSSIDRVKLNTLYEIESNRVRAVERQRRSYKSLSVNFTQQHNHTALFHAFIQIHIHTSTVCKQTFINDLKNVHSFNALRSCGAMTNVSFRASYHLNEFVLKN